MHCLKCKKPVDGQDVYGLHPACFKDWFKPGGEFTQIEQKRSFSASSSSPYSDFKKSKDTFYHGRYQKYSAALGEEKYILKTKEDSFPDLPETEYMCNQIASLLDLSPPPYYLILFKAQMENPAKEETQHKGLMTFVTKNFIKKGHTLHHIYKFLPKGQENYNCKNIINILIKETRQLINVKLFLHICLFDAFIGNGDRHGRNLGIIDTGKAKFLAPPYDNPSFIGTEKEELLGADIQTSGCIYTSRTKEPKLKDYIQEFNALGYREIGKSFIKKIISQYPHIKQKIEESGILPKRKSHFIKFLNQKLEELKKCLLK